jgi:penicillin-binding protein-related factor A (putative recombinase)
MARKSEQKYTTILKKSFHNLGAWFYKIPDSPNQFQFAKPFDAFLVVRGISMAIEAKWIDWTRSGSGFSKKQLRGSQISGLSDHFEAGGRSYVVLFLKAQRSEIRLYVWKWCDILELWDKSNGVIPRKELEKMEYITLENNSFDLSEFIDREVNDFFYQRLIS